MNSSNETTRRHSKLVVAIGSDMAALVRHTSKGNYPECSKTARPGSILSILENGQWVQWHSTGLAIVRGIKNNLDELRALPIMSLGNKSTIDNLTEDAHKLIAQFTSLAESIRPNTATGSE